MDDKLPAIEVLRRELVSLAAQKDREQRVADRAQRRVGATAAKIAGIEVALKHLCGESSGVPKEPENEADSDESAARRNGIASLVRHLLPKLPIEFQIDDAANLACAERPDLASENLRESVRKVLNRLAGEKEVVWIKKRGEGRRPHLLTRVDPKETGENDSVSTDPLDSIDF